MIHDLDILLSMVKSKVSNIHASGVLWFLKRQTFAMPELSSKMVCVANLTTSRISMKAMRKSRFFFSKMLIFL